MSHIAKFTVEGLAGRPEAISQELHPDINIFFGVNGSGKTTLLKLLHSALSGRIAVLRRTPFKSAVVEVMTPRGPVTRKLVRLSEKHTVVLKDGTRYFYSSSDGTMRHGEEWEWKTIPDDAPYPGEGGWAHSYLPTTRLYGVRGDTMVARAYQEEYDESELDARFSGLLERTWNRYNANISRRVREAQERGLTALVSEIVAPAENPLMYPSQLGFDDVYELVSSFWSRQSRKVPLGPIDVFKTRYEKDQQLRNVVNHLSVVELGIREAVAPRTKLQELLNRMFVNKKVAIRDDAIVVTSGDTNIPIAALSSGEKHALRLFVEAASGHRNPIIIDEPELSLHVDWQRELVASIRELKPECQLIVATHSPEIMAGIDDANIFRL